VEVGKVSEALVQVEAVADEELVGDGEADVADREVLDETSVRAIEQRDGVESRRPTKAKRANQEVQRQSRVDHVFDDQHVAAADLGVEVLEQADAASGAVGRDLEEVELVRAADGA
jgi:hypothetical protein